MCKYCENINEEEFDKVNVLLDTGYEDFRIYREGNVFIGEVYGSSYADKQMFYCPLCGRKLSEVQHEGD